MKDCLHIWQFLRDLLKEKNQNDNLIQWLDQASGIFKINKPEIVSRLWGYKKSQKSDMKYANMARGIRLI